VPSDQTLRSAVVDRFFHGAGHSYDQIVRLTLLGQDGYWKRRLLAKVPPSSAILDLACGTGIVTFGLAARNPQARVVGVDFTKSFLDVAREKARALGANVEFIQSNAETVVLTESFDCITSSYLPKYVDPDTLLANITPALQSGGVIVLHDFLYPANPVLRMNWHIYNWLLNVAGKRIWPEWGPVFDELAPLIKRSRWIDDFAAAFPRHGYVDVRTERLTLGHAGIIWAKKA
jgi:demethylmenaquinone methyltransferase/2-methoxy-6-polyprenyl-1,4-benzoquinol methylase